MGSRADTRQELKSSERRAVANRRNARNSTGPKSVEGKAVVACNAVRHGLLSWRPVLPEVERAEDWERHLHATLEALAPQGHLETLLAERLALLTWRLNRVARYEAASLAADQEGLGGRTGSDDARTDEEHAHQAFLDLARQDDHDSVEPDLAEWVIDQVAAHAQVVIDTEEDPTFVEPSWFPRDGALSDFEGWTAGGVREYLACVAAKAERDLDRLWAEAVNAARSRSEASRQAKEERRLQRVARSRVEHLVPPAHKSQPLLRYEAAIERSLFRTLHELQRLQATRQGQCVVPPLVVDVDVSGAASEPGDAALSDGH